MPDSYFGYIGNSFYAGPNGASFQIKKTYQSYTEMWEDRNNLLSGVLYGDYVAIDYGDQNNPDQAPAGKNSYNQNKQIDQNNNYSYQNASIWQKVSTTIDNQEQADYTRLFGSVAAIPDIEISTETGSGSWIAPGDDSTEIISKVAGQSLDAQSFSLKRTAAWNIGVKADIERSAGEGPSVLVNRSATNSTDTGAIDSGNDTTKYIHFGIPEAWDIQKGAGKGVEGADALNPSALPAVTIDKQYSSDSSDSSESDTTKYIHFGIPKSWDIQKGKGRGTSGSDQVNPGDGPSVSIDTIDTNGNTSSTTKYIHFGLPNAWQLNAERSAILPPGSTPSVIMTGETTEGQQKTHKKLQFSLPTSAQIGATPTLNLLGPEAQNANIGTNTSGTYGQITNFTFNLPRGARIYAGSSLDEYGRATSGTERSYQGNSTVIKNMLPGDVYISTTYGTIWKMKTAPVEVENNNISCTFTSQGVAQLPVPTVAVDAVSPNYNSDTGEPDFNPSATGTPTSTGWTLTLSLPKAPSINADQVRLVPSDAANTGVQVVPDGDTINITALIPKGSRMFAGPLADIGTQSGWASGDYYIATDTYAMYRYTNSQPVQVIEDFGGQSFAIIGNIMLTDDDLSGVAGADAEAKIKNYLTAHSSTSADPYYPLPEPNRQVYLVTYEHEEVDSGQTVTVQTVYWFYHDGSFYQDVQLTVSKGGSIIITVDPMSVDTVPSGDKVTFSANGILSLKNSLNEGKAPNNHASSSTTYGIGTSENYGHTKLFDNFDDTTNTTTKDATSGVAATPKAVYNSLAWGSWANENGSYVLRKNGTIITNTLS